MATNPRYNASGCKDLTAYKALDNVEREEKRVRKILRVLRSVCELSGYQIKGYVVLVDSRTGKQWRVK